MIIAQISDTHIALDAPDAGERLDDFARTIADINALDPAPDAIVHTGDVVHNGRADEYAEAAAVLARARAPVYVIAGNKDDRTNLRAAFSHHGYLAPEGGFIDYVVEDHPVRLIGLDTLSAVGNKGDFCPERVRRLIAMSDAEKWKPIAVLAHHPPFVVPVGPDPINFETEESMDRLARALQHTNRVAGVLSGHVHRATRGRVGAIPALVAPSIATTLRKGEYPARMKSRPVYYLHRFDGCWGFCTEARIVAAPDAVAVACPPARARKSA